MTSFATLPPNERALIVNQVAGRAGVAPLIVEKDFWVCWALGHIFSAVQVAPHVVFKGGTSLSKVHGVIQRFSEDIDLAVLPGALGFSEQVLNDAPSASARRKLMQAVAAECARCVEARFRPVLEGVFRVALGPPQAGEHWLHFEIDASAATPNLLFAYPSALPQPGGYIAKQVKLEFGALTNQQPTGQHRIATMLATAPGTALAQAFDDLQADVTALALARTFWEKATILHAEYHRPPKLPIRDRFARHYADFAALWAHAGREDALRRLDLLQDVVQHKGRFFASAWANYASARPGSFRLVPPAHRRAVLAQDYAKMEPMFMTPPPAFDHVLGQLAEAERALNQVPKP
ncbi:MAG: nucleotidyl transferase AbiEii/AbiGii toxin family protein [Bacteriovorax sp.]|nr:nucleotidyl transferase AbiEii/AbiGii toxin family protein [Rhizobacter sp.]